ncbi:MAG: alpha/beta fold hydrolase [Rhizobiaceae bacterium]
MGIVKGGRSISPVDDPSLEIFMRYAIPNTQIHTPVLCVHGATIASALFDADGESLLDDLASLGIPAYALDIRGYARSLPPSDAPDNRPYARATEAVLDVDAAVRTIMKEHPSRTVSLVGMSWGTIISSVYATGIGKGLIERLVLIAPICDHVDTKELERLMGGMDEGQIPAFRFVSKETFVERLQQEHPTIAEDEWLLRGVLDDVFKNSLQNQQTGKIQVPNGCLVDLISAFKGKGFYNPANISVPTLIARGTKDPTSSRPGALSIYDRLGGAATYLEVSGAAHFGLIEKNGSQIRNGICSFLKQLRPNQNQTASRP